MSSFNKYLKYKHKYLQLKNIYGGSQEEFINSETTKWNKNAYDLFLNETSVYQKIKKITQNLNNSVIQRIISKCLLLKIFKISDIPKEDMTLFNLVEFKQCIAFCDKFLNAIIDEKLNTDDLIQGETVNYIINILYTEHFILMNKENVEKIKNLVSYIFSELSNKDLKKIQIGRKFSNDGTVIEINKVNFINKSSFVRVREFVELNKQRSNIFLKRASAIINFINKNNEIFNNSNHLKQISEMISSLKIHHLKFEISSDHKFTTKIITKNDNTVEYSYYEITNNGKKSYVVEFSFDEDNKITATNIIKNESVAQ